MKSAGIWKSKTSGISYAVFLQSDEGESWKGETGCVLTVPLKFEPEPNPTVTGIWTTKLFNDNFVLVKK